MYRVLLIALILLAALWTVKDIACGSDPARWAADSRGAEFIRDALSR